MKTRKSSSQKCNLKDSSPFAPQHRDGLSEKEKQSWQQLFREYIEDETLGRITQTIAVFPEEENGVVYASFGSLLNTKGKYKKALKEFELALKTNPDFSDDALFKSLSNQLQNKVKR